DRFPDGSSGRSPSNLVDLVSPTEERNPASAELDALDARGAVELILDEDAKVAAAVRARSAVIAGLVEQCVQAIEAGGTGHYIGAGTSGRLGVLDAVELAPTFNGDESMGPAHPAAAPTACAEGGGGAEAEAGAGAERAR